MVQSGGILAANNRSQNEDEMTRKELDNQHKKLYKKISKLYSGYTPVKDILELYRQLEIAYQNELKRLKVNNRR